MQGLGFPILSAQNVTPPFFNMVQQNALPKAQFSIWLHPDMSAATPGEMVLGGIDQSQYTGELWTIPLSSERCEPLNAYSIVLWVSLSIALRPCRPIQRSADCCTHLHQLSCPRLLLQATPQACMGASFVARVLSHSMCRGH